MTITLMPHQQEAVKFFKEHPRAILGDRRGVGKTYPALIALKEETDNPKPHFLYICPAYQMPQNSRKIADIYPNDPVQVVQRGDKPDPKATWFITSYHTLTDAGLAATPWLSKAQWDGIIFDEGHRLRRRQNQWTKNAKPIAKKAKRVYLLTGTPQVKDPGDYWAQLNILDRPSFPSYWNFVNEWCRTTQTPWKVEIIGLIPDLKDAFAHLLSKYMLRRDITLPAPTEYDVPIAVEPAIRQEHKRAKDEWIIDFPDDSDPQYITGGGALVIKLRRLTAFSEVKLDAVTEILEDMPGDQAVVYTWFRDSATRLAEHIKKKTGRPVTHVDGSIPALRRSELIDKWKTLDEGILVATIPSVQEGLDLQNAATAIFFEVPYTWSDCDQAIGRVHRQGQTRQVSVHYVRAAKTVDDTVHRVMMRRRNEAEDIEATMKAILDELRREAEE